MSMLREILADKVSTLKYDSTVSKTIRFIYRKDCHEKLI